MDTEIYPDTEESSTSSHTIEYVYEDEILPEIEIREVISVDTFLKENPKFIAIDDETFLVLLNQLFTNNIKSKGFFNLHKTIINDYYNDDIFKNIFVHVDAIRKINEDITIYFEEQERAKRAPTFDLQQVELNKLRYPFDPEKIIQESQYILNEHEPSHIVIKNKDSSPYTPLDISKVLLIDDINLPVLGAYWKYSSIYKLLYIYETNNIEDFKYIKWNNVATNKKEAETIDEKLSFNDWLFKYVQPQFKNVIANISSISSLHDYTLLFANAGYDINNLTIYQTKKLNKHLEELLNTNDEKVATNKKSKSYPQIQYSYPYLSYIESFQRHFDRYRAYFQEDRLFRIQENLGSYIANLPNFQNDIDSYDPYTLVTQVIQGIKTIDDIKNIVKQLYIRDQFSRADSLLKKLTVSKTYVSIDKFKLLYDNLNNSKNDEINKAFISLYNDINEVKVGNDISKYDGTPSTVQQTVYEETQYDVIIDETIDTTPEEEIFDSLPDKLNEQFTELENAHDGSKDILNYVLPFLIKIRDASGLPWNINSWIKLYSTEIQRESRINKIQKEIEDINPYILQRICINSFDMSMQLIDDLNNIEIADKLKTLYPIVFSQWENDCKEAFFYGLSIWLLDLLELSINGNLDFSILNGMLSYAELWSPYGPPLVDKKTSNGIIFYISAIAASLLPYNIQSNVIEDKIMNILNNKYKERTELLKEKWNKIKEKQERQDKATQAKLSLIEVSRKLLAKEKVNFSSTFIKAYYYLPTLIPKKHIQAFKKQPIWAQGCCLSKLDDSYEADNDWKNDIKPLWSMKNKLAEDRWLITKRDNLKIFSKDKQKESNSINFEKQSECFIATKEDEDINNPVIFKPNDSWLQKSHYNTLYHEAREGSTTLIKQCIQLAYQRVKADNIITILNSLYQINDIQHILNKIIKSIFTKLIKTKDSPIESKILDDTKIILFNMKSILNQFLNAKNTEYNACVYRARYILARAMCLPGIPQNNKLVVPDNVSATFYANILRDNLNILTEWNKNNSMLTPFEIQAYITKMREEQKKSTLSKLDVLSIDDMQLMKDMKRFGLMKMFEKTEPNETVEVNAVKTDDDTGINVPINEDQDGEAEWLQQPTDEPDINENDDILE